MKKIRVYDHDEETHFDKDGRPYIGISIEELQKLEKGEKKTVLSEKQPTIDNDIGLIYTLK